MATGTVAHVPMIATKGIVQMSDLSKLLGLFDELKIKHTVDYNTKDDNKICVLLETGKPDTRVVGYRGFHSEWWFNRKEEFITVGIWE